MTTTTYRTPRKTAEMGFQALIEKLGCGGALVFISQYETGEGNYTVERKKILVNFRLESQWNGSMALLLISRTDLRSVDPRSVYARIMSLHSCLLPKSFEKRRRALYLRSL